jgi:saccharopine dehydrogenase-like NADP-dependent oxidoreductase
VLSLLAKVVPKILNPCQATIQKTAIFDRFSDMKKILIIGAGRSSANLIKYLLEHAAQYDWHIRVGDMDVAFAQSKIGISAHATAFKLDASNDEERRREIENSDLVISMLPAAMHMKVALDCIDLSKNVITPSYIPDEMWELHETAKQKGIVILNEMGVDPGIDHMSAMKIIDRLKVKGAKLESFESFTGGLIAPESDNNPWHYKITWNPRNVVLAGYGGTARFKENGSVKFIPYHKLFERLTHVDLGADGEYTGYGNRDSLKYLKLYNLEEIPTLYRGTLRGAGYCEAWNLLVQLGLTDDSFELTFPEGMTWNSLTSSFLPSGEGSIQQRLSNYLSTTPASLEMLEWLGIFDDRPLGMTKGSPAQALQRLIEARWKLEENDTDMIVMWHRFRYILNGSAFELQSKLITYGDDPTHTAMSKTVGLPIAIAAKHILQGTWKLSGVYLPTHSHIYEPVLQELASMGIIFSESEQPM